MAQLRSSVPGLLLLRLRPLGIGNLPERESVASWVCRLAWQNGFQRPGDMFRHAQQSANDLGRIDLGESGRKALRMLAELTGISDAEATCLHLEHILQVLGADSDRTGHPWVVDAGMAPKGPLGARHAVCPRCLREDATPYWRQAWRLSIRTHCCAHSCRLAGECQRCGTPAVLTSWRTAPLALCEACLRPYEASRRSYFLRHERWLVPHPTQLELSHLPLSPPIPAAWWAGVRHLLALISKPSCAGRLLKAEMPVRHRRCLAAISARSSPRFIDADLETRRQQLHLIAWLLADWPDRFIRVMQEARVTAADLQSMDFRAPYWVSSIAYQTLVKRAYRVNGAEVDAAIRVLRDGGRTPSKIALKRLLGVTEAIPLDQALGRCSKRLTDGEFAQVLALIDACVEHAPKGRSEWGGWVRDAACFAMVAWNGLPRRRIPNVDLKEGEKMIRECLELQPAASEALVIQASILARWMTTYLERVRPVFLGQCPSNRPLYLTRFAQPYGGNGLAGHLAPVLRDAGVRDWSRGYALLASVQLKHRFYGPRDAHEPAKLSRRR